MKTVYLETTIPSYLVSRPVRDIIVLAHQELTRTWWETRRMRYRMVISQVVMDECGSGDPKTAKQRTALIQDLSVLKTTSEIEDLAAQYREKLNIPKRAARDAAHLAFACLYRIDYLLTWNCRHLANAEIMSELFRLNADMGVWTPVICTPGELIEPYEEEVR